jgi:transcriptional regulator with XRE-family HTH domain
MDTAPSEGDTLARPPKLIVIPQKQIGKRLRALRLKRDLSQVELALALGTKQANVSDIERGVRGVTVQQLVKVCRVLGSTPNEILGETKTPKPSPNGHIRDRRFLRRLQNVDKLSRRQKDALLMTIDNFLKGAGAEH